MPRAELSTGPISPSERSESTAPVRRFSSLAARAVYGLARASAVAAAAVTCFLALLLVAGVASRELTGTSIPGVHEFVRTLLVAVVFLGLPYAERTNAHVRVTLLTGRLSTRTRAMVRAISLSIALVIVVLLIQATYERAQVSFATGEHAFATIRVPIWPARWAIVFGLALLILVLAFKIVDNILIAAGRAPLMDDTLSTADESLVTLHEPTNPDDSELVLASAKTTTDRTV